MNSNCVAGCKHFTGGEIKHHEDCPYYPDSMSEMYDQLKNENRLLETKVIIWYRNTRDEEFANYIGIKTEGFGVIKKND